MRAAAGWGLYLRDFADSPSCAGIRIGLAAELLRRDQIWLTEKRADQSSSSSVVSCVEKISCAPALFSSGSWKVLIFCRTSRGCRLRSSSSMTSVLPLRMMSRRGTREGEQLLRALEFVIIGEVGGALCPLMPEIAGPEFRRVRLSCYAAGREVQLELADHTLLAHRRDGSDGDIGRAGQGMDLMACMPSGFWTMLVEKVNGTIPPSSRTISDLVSQACSGCSCSLLSWTAVRRKRDQSR